VDQTALLGARDEVVDEDPETPILRRLESADDGSKIVDPIQHLDDDSLDPQVVAPDLLNELGVVLSLHKDA